MTDLAERALAIGYAQRLRLDAERAARPPIAEERERNRAQMPETARILDELRQVFGKPAYFRFTENGATVEWGKR